jgi:hypothetical protein
MSTRLPGRTRPAPPPSSRLNTIAPRPPRCPTGRRRYQSEDTAKAHHHSRSTQRVVVHCTECSGWHFVKGIDFR